MARLVRVSSVGIPQRIVHPGDNSRVCFCGEEDMRAYLNWLKEFSKKYNFDVHACVLMTNRVHLLCTPLEEGAISRMVQPMGLMYVRNYNYDYQRNRSING